LINVEVVTKKSRIAIFTQNSARIIDRTLRFRVTHGSPPISVPSGTAWRTSSRG